MKISHLVPVIVTGALASTQLYAKVNVSGYLETDLISESVTSNTGEKDAKDTEVSKMDMAYWGSIVVEGIKEENGYTLTTKLEPTTTGGTVGLENAYISLAKGGLMVQAGRFESMETYSTGMDAPLMLHDDSTIAYDDHYIGESIRQFDSNKVSVGYNTGMLGAELALSTLNKGEHFTTPATTAGGEETKSGANMTGIRPAFSFETAGFKAALSVESVAYAPHDKDSKREHTMMGNSVHLGYSTAMFAAGVNVASGVTSGKDAAGEDIAEVTNTSTTVTVDALGVVNGGDIGFAYHMLAGSQKPKVGDEMTTKQTALTLVLTQPLPADSSFTFGVSSNSWEQDTGGDVKPTVTGTKLLFRLAHSI